MYQVSRIKNKGFTIVELLIVSAIIALLASIVFTAITGTRARSRDARRETDIKEIQNALNLYAVNRRAFPVCSPEVVINGSSDCMSAQLLAAGAMTQVPIDPSGKANGAASDCGVTPTTHIYCYVSDGNIYTLRHHLETDSIQGKASGWHAVGP